MTGIRQDTHQEDRSHELADARSGHRAQVIVFWALLTMGFVGFAPCVLLPEWRQYETLQLTEQKEAWRLEQMERMVERERALYKALRDDPAVLARLAQRDLSYRRLDQQVVPVGAEVAVDRIDTTVDGAGFAVHETPHRPVIGMIASRLPAYDYDAVFCDDRTRSIIMTMSIALMVLALVLFPRSRSTRE